MDFSDLFMQSFPAKVCDVCLQEKRDIEYSDPLKKWICSDCMSLPQSSEGF